MFQEREVWLRSVYGNRGREYLGDAVYECAKGVFGF
jgi:hypothetical protein